MAQRELARRIGVSGSFVSRVETGQCPPSVVTLCAIASELGIPVNDLLSDPGEGLFDRDGAWRRSESAGAAAQR